MSTILIFATSQANSDSVAGDLPHPDLVVAADGGYDYALRMGFEVDVLIGDFDSITATDLPEHLLIERHRPDKDASDLELAFESVIREEPQRVVVVGGDGGRIDHELTTSGLLGSDRWRGIDEIDWISARGRVHVVRSHRLVHGDIGATVTLLPVGGPANDVTTTGLKWNLNRENLVAGSSRGLSNEMTSPVADIKVGEGCLLAVFPAS